MHTYRSALSHYATKPNAAAVILAVSFVVIAAQSASAETISLNWKEFAGAPNDVLDGYGVEPANNWQNLQVTNGTDVVTSSGATSTVDFSANAIAGFATFNFGTLNNTPMRAGMDVYTASPNPLTITLSDLAATFVDYDVIVYVTGFNAAAGGNIGSISDGASTFVYTVPNPFVTTLIQSTDTNPGDGADVATYVRFDGLTADSTTISLTALNGGVGIGGLQITGTLVPEPTTAGLVMIAGLVLLARRRR